MAGTEVAFGTQIVSDKLVEAFQVPGNQQVLSKLFDVDDYAKPLGLDKTALVEKLKIDAIGNIRAATDLSDAQRIALIAVVDRDVSQYSMKFMRRTQAAGLFENARYEFTPGLAASGPGAAQQARKLVVDVRYSEIATELDNIHPGLKYDYVRGTTGTYWDRVTVAGPDTKTLTYGFDSLDDDAGVFILRENGAQEYLPGATRDEFVKTQLREMVTSEGYELDSAQKLVTDPDTGKVVADQVGFEIQIGCCSQATQHQLDNLEAAKIASTQTQTAEIVRIQQTTNQLAAKARAGTLDLIDIERQFEAAGFSVEIKDFHTLAGENLAAAIETTGQNLFKAQANNFENNIIAGIPENARRMAFQLIDN